MKASTAATSLPNGLSSALLSAKRRRMSDASPTACASEASVSMAAPSSCSTTAAESGRTKSRARRRASSPGSRSIQAIVRDRPSTAPASAAGSRRKSGCGSTAATQRSWSSRTKPARRGMPPTLASCSRSRSSVSFESTSRTARPPSDSRSAIWSRKRTRVWARAMPASLVGGPEILFDPAQRRADPLDALDVVASANRRRDQLVEFRRLCVEVGLADA